MRKLKILKNIFHTTGTSKILIGFLTFILITGYALYIVEFNADNQLIRTPFDALYYTVVTVCTVGFGDIVPITILGKILSMALMICGVLVVGLITGIFATFYEELNQRRNKDTINQFVERLERLPELSHDELMRLSKRVIKYKNK